MLMMMMMMKKKGSKSLAVVALFYLAAVDCVLPPSKEDLNTISTQGENYLDTQIENAINGVKEMKSVMAKSSEDHQKYLDALEKTKLQKEEAMRTAQEMEAKLEQEEEVCNETMRSLWEECKPCLKKTCVKFYSRTCSSGSGLVGRQLEDVLNRTSPFSIFINRQKMDTLKQEGRRQNDEFWDLEGRYTTMEDGVDSIFSNSMKVAEHVHSSPLLFGLHDFFSPFIRRSRSLLRDPFHNWFSPTMGNNFFSSIMDLDSNAPPNENSDGGVQEDVVITRPFGDSGMTCREIRRNSAGCLRLRDECEKCREIEHVDCLGKKPLEGPEKEQLEEALAVAERFTQQYNSLLRRFEEQMFNTSSILDLFNKQFGWVSSLGNTTKDSIFRVHTVNCKDAQQAAPGGQEKPGDTSVSVKLFDSAPMNLTVPGDIPWTDPKFSKVVAQEALDRYKESSIVVK